MQSNFESSLNFSASSRMNEMLSNEFEFSLCHIQITFGYVNANYLRSRKFFGDFPGQNASTTCEIQERTLRQKFVPVSFSSNTCPFLSVPYETTPSYVVSGLIKKFRYKIFCRFCQHYISRTK